MNIAALFPTSGDLARPGETCLTAAKLATDDINTAGGVKAPGGAKINLISADLRSAPPDGVAPDLLADQLDADAGQLRQRLARIIHRPCEHLGSGLQLASRSPGERRFGSHRCPFGALLRRNLIPGDPVNNPG